MFVAFAALATQEIIESSPMEAGYIEVGYISRIHGLHGEICVKPTTDFPELRFCEVTTIRGKSLRDSRYFPSA